jgi:FlaA1/EpsC-like NDP-sugar epimerase
MNMTETILVTGSTGNIGSEIIKQLSNCKSDINLKAAVRSEDNRIKNGKDLKSVQCNKSSWTSAGQ